MVGLIPLFAVETLEPGLLEKLPEFSRAAEWFLSNRPDLASLVSRWQEPGMGERRLLSLLRGHRMKMLLKRMLDETEFLSDYGVRAVSRHHEANPYVFDCDGQWLSVKYEPAESDSGLFGGNSNWRGPIWFPVNYLLIESLQKFHHYYGDDFKVECPTGSGNLITIERGRRGAVAPADADLPARRAGQAPGVRRASEAAERPALPRPRAVLRVLPRRHRPRRRRLAPDRLDRPGRQAAAAAPPRAQATREQGQLTCDKRMEDRGSAAGGDAALRLRKVLAGQKALVTGANSGIGRAVALALGKAGADVVVNYVVEARAGARRWSPRSRHAGGKALTPIRPTSASEDQVQAMFATMLEEFGTIDILVNNAGLQQDARLRGDDARSNGTR